MDVTPLIRKDAKVIQSYKGGIFKVSGEVYETPLIVLPDQVMPWIVSGQGFSVNDFEILKPYLDQVEVLLLGTGNKLVMPAPILRRQVKEAFGISLEVMDTGAACRTYNVLLAEGRKMAAALDLFN